MGAQATTLSSLGVSTPIMLNPVFKTTTIQITASSGSSGSNIFAQYTLDDPTSTPAPTISWANLSSAIATSSGIDLAGGVLYTVLSPLGGLRLSSTTAVSGTITLKALQSVTA